MRYRYCKECSEVHEADRHWGEGSAASIQIIKDIQPYQAMGADIALGGEPPRITSRSEHREYLKRNGYIEVGNEPIRERKIDYKDVTPREVRQVYEQLRDRR